MTRGTKKNPRQQLQDELDKLKARLTPGGARGLITAAAGSLGQFRFTLECKRATLPAVLRLLGEVLREPTFPPEELEILKRQRKETLEKNKKEPFALALEALIRKLSPYD